MDEDIIETDNKTKINNTFYSNGAQESRTIITYHTCDTDEIEHEKKIVVSWFKSRELKSIVKFWDGHLHSEDKNDAAVILFYKNGQIERHEYYKHDQLSRLNGPAQVLYERDGTIKQSGNWIAGVSQDASYFSDQQTQENDDGVEEEDDEIEQLTERLFNSLFCQ
jgi:antitoxin component YwqK of YwqJK toxin-antitoxin module